MLKLRIDTQIRKNKFNTLAINKLMDYFE